MASRSTCGRNYNEAPCREHDESDNKNDNLDIVGGDFFLTASQSPDDDYDDIRAGHRDGMASCKRHTLYIHLSNDLWRF